MNFSVKILSDYNPGMLNLEEGERWVLTKEWV